MPLPSASSSFGQCLALLDDGGLKKQKKVNDRRGGSAQFEYNNSQMNAFKAFRASDRKLTDAEIIHARERCKQGWERLPAAEKNSGTWFTWRALKGEFRHVSPTGLTFSRPT